MPDLEIHCIHLQRRKSSKAVIVTVAQPTAATAISEPMVPPSITIAAPDQPVDPVPDVDTPAVDAMTEVPAADLDPEEDAQQMDNVEDQPESVMVPESPEQTPETEREQGTVNVVVAEPIEAEHVPTPEAHPPTAEIQPEIDVNTIRAPVDPAEVAPVTSSMAVVSEWAAGMHAELVSPDHSITEAAPEQQQHGVMASEGQLQGEPALVVLESTVVALADFEAQVCRAVLLMLLPTKSCPCSGRGRALI